MAAMPSCSDQFLEDKRDYNNMTTIDVFSDKNQANAVFAVLYKQILENYKSPLHGADVLMRQGKGALLRISLHTPAFPPFSSLRLYIWGQRFGYAICTAGLLAVCHDFFTIRRYNKQKVKEDTLCRFSFGRINTIFFW